MGVKQWNPGDVLTAADMNAWAVPLAVMKPADTSRTSNTTLTADPDLTLAVAANALYRFWCFLDYEGAALGTGDIKWQFTVPTSSTLRYHLVCWSPLGAANTQNTMAAGGTANAGTINTGNLAGATMHGTLDTAGTAGSITLLWAQITSNATSTILHAQSAMVLDRIG